MEGLKKKRLFLSVLFLCFSSIFSGKGFTTIILPDGFILKAELALNPQEWIKGLMFRESIPDDYGMLFVFKEPDYHYFWMKNTLVPLDIAWLNEKKVIIYIKENCKPCKEKECESFGPNLKAKYVLEVKAGFFKKHNIKVGDRLYFYLP